MEPREAGDSHQESEGIDASKPPILEEGHSPSSSTIFEIWCEPSLSSRHIIIRRVRKSAIVDVVWCLGILVRCLRPEPE